LTKKAEWVVKLLGDREFLAGKNLTYLDFALVEMFEILKWLSEGAFYQNNPKVDEYSSRVKNLPGLKEFMDSEESDKYAFFGIASYLNNK
jgi:glutathione S-transferase